MFLTRALIAFFEFFLSAFVSVLIVYVMYRIFIMANRDYDGEEEIKKGNIAVAILTAAIMVSASWIIQHALTNVVNLFKMYLTTPIHQGTDLWHFVLFAFSHMFVSFCLAVFTISFSLRLFGKLGRRMHMGQELAKGNIAVGIFLAGALFVICTFVSNGVSSLSKALMPQPSIGTVQVMK